MTIGLKIRHALTTFDKIWQRLPTFDNVWQPAVFECFLSRNPHEAERNALALRPWRSCKLRFCFVFWAFLYTHDPGPRVEQRLFRKDLSSIANQRSKKIQKKQKDPNQFENEIFAQFARFRNQNKYCSVAAPAQDPSECEIVQPPIPIGLC